MSSDNSRPDSSLGSRVASLETELRGYITHSDTQFSSIKDSISNLSQLIIQSNRTDWPTILTLLGLVVTIAGGLGYMAVMPLKEHQAHISGDVKELDKKLDAHVSDGHPRRVEAKVEHNAKQLEILDIALQREMRILDERIADQIKSLDDRLQMEMRLIQDARDERLSGVDDRLTSLEAFRMKRESVPERVRSLERAVFDEERERLNHDE